jgi:hypothetical protein
MSDGTQPPVIKLHDNGPLRVIGPVAVAGMRFVQRVVPRVGYFGVLRPDSPVG